MFGSFSQIAEAAHAFGDGRNLLFWQNQGNNDGHGTGGLDEFVNWNNGVIHESSYNHITKGLPDVCEIILGTEFCIKQIQWFPPLNINCLVTDCGWTTNNNQVYQDLHFGAGSDKPHVVMAGFSFGGGSAAFIATDSRNNDIPFSIVWLVDPVGPTYKGQGAPTRQGVFRDCGISHPNSPVAQLMS